MAALGGTGQARAPLPCTAHAPPSPPWIHLDRTAGGPCRDRHPSRRRLAGIERSPCPPSPTCRHRRPDGRPGQNPRHGGPPEPPRRSSARVATAVPARPGPTGPRAGSGRTRRYRRSSRRWSLSTIFEAMEPLDGRLSVGRRPGRHAFTFDPDGTCPASNQTITLCVTGRPATAISIVVANSGRARHKTATPEDAAACASPAVTKTLRALDSPSPLPQNTWLPARIAQPVRALDC